MEGRVRKAGGDCVLKGAVSGGGKGREGRVGGGGGKDGSSIAGNHLEIIKAQSKAMTSFLNE